MPFRPDEVTRFRLTGFAIDAEAGTVRLGYAFDDRHVFHERIDLGALHPMAARAADPAVEAGFARVVRLLHLAAGVSYYKAAAPDVIAVETGPLSDLERRFVHDLYDKGLREFAWRNGLPLARRLEIEDLAGARPPAEPAEVAAPPPGVGIPIGGGKDSAVVVEALRAQRPVLLSVNGHPAAHRVAAAAGLPLAVVRRSLDPHLLELNGQGALNGHVPITAIVSLVAVAAGYRFGYDTTVMALERSADEPTRTGPARAGDAGAGMAAPGGSDGGPDAEVPVNHQWSKSSEFERSLTDVLAASVGTGVHYRSVLRRTGELDIAATFATLRRYHHAFVSCNRAFTQSGGADGWCGHCPKCRFVYLSLATVMAPADLVAIFGTDLLADPDQVEGFRDLFEEGRKPFECVGTRAESLLAIAVLGRRPQWAAHPVVAALAPGATAAIGPDVAARWRPADATAVLDGIRRAVHAPAVP
jgi:hypothetical protein